MSVHRNRWIYDIIVYCIIYIEKRWLRNYFVQVCSITIIIAFTAKLDFGLADAQSKEDKRVISLNLFRCAWFKIIYFDPDFCVCVHLYSRSKGIKIKMSRRTVRINICVLSKVIVLPPKTVVCFS